MRPLHITNTIWILESLTALPSWNFPLTNSSLVVTKQAETLFLTKIFAKETKSFKEFQTFKKKYHLKRLQNKGKRRCFQSKSKQDLHQKNRFQLKNQQFSMEKLISRLSTLTSKAKKSKVKMLKQSQKPLKK